MSLKVHNDPWKMRPIVYWLDRHFQKLKPLIKTYICDSADLLRKLSECGRIPPDAKLFTADANSMYTNINTPYALLVITLWIN